MTATQRFKRGRALDPKKDQGRLDHEPWLVMGGSPRSLNAVWEGSSSVPNLTIPRAKRELGDTVSEDGLFREQVRVLNHVLILSSQFPNPAEPTRGVFTEQLVLELRRRCRVSVVSPQPWVPPSGPFPAPSRWRNLRGIPESVVRDDVTVSYPRYLAVPKMGGWSHALAAFVAVLPKVRRIHRRCPVDVVNAHWAYPDGVAAVWTASVLKIPVVVSALGCDINLLATSSFPLRRIQIRTALRSAAGCTAKSAPLAESIITELGVPRDRVEVIMNGVDTEAFTTRPRASSRAALGLTDGGSILLYVGRLSEEKGLETLIEAVGMQQAELAAQNARLVIVGAGALQERLVARVRALRCDGRVAFAGAITHDKIPLWISASDALCLPSYREGCPNVVLEAFACGRPVVATRVGGVPRLVGERNGIIVAPRNAQELGAALSRVLAMDWDEEAIRASIAPYTWQAAVEAYRRVYAAAVARTVRMP